MPALAGKANIEKLTTHPDRLVKKIPLCRRANHLYKPARLALDQEGRFAIVTNVERGMRWTRYRQLTSDDMADGEVVWS